MNIMKTYLQAYEHLKTKDPILYKCIQASATFVCAEGILETENTVICEYFDGKLNIENELTTVGFALTTAFEPYIGNSEIMDMKSVVH